MAGRNDRDLPQERDLSAVEIKLMGYVDIVIDNKSRHTDELYTYRTDRKLRVGQVVSVPFGKGKKNRRGFVFRVDVAPDYDPSKIRSIADVIDEYALTEEAVNTIAWMRQRYGIRYMDGIRCFIPGGKPPRPGREKHPYASVRPEPQNIEDLTGEQQEALKRIYAAADEKRQASFLLHGVTGSGKTEVYMQAIAHVIAEGRGAIMLVPEIALTKQIVERFAGRFGMENIAVLHSKLTVRERYDEWMRVFRGEAKIVIGARIGVFAPLRNIGLIIMDEEHEATYKSDQTPKYETVDIAAKRLMYHHGIMILGSATPSVVSYQRAREGIYELLIMKHRYNEVPLPSVELVDMKKEIRSGNRTAFSDSLYRQMRKALDERSQIILFLNRRGYSTYLSCSHCGESLKCPECGITLVYHKRENAALCHYCGRKYPVPDICPSCGEGEIRYLGTGTEKVEEEAHELFPESSIERFDLDTAVSSREINRILGSFSKGKTDILIGTQLVAKGLDFRNVGLVGVISADVSLNIPDYRATERTFQLVTQVAGRSGRGDRQGKVVVQTLTPDNFALRAAAAHDYHDFFNKEIAVRRMMDYPPFTDLIAAEFTSEDEETAIKEAGRCRDYMIRAGLPGAEGIFLPQVSSAFKGNSASRWHILMKCPKGERNKYIYYLRYFGEQMTRRRIACSLTIDVNPYSTC